VHRIRLFTLILAGAFVLCADGLRLGQTQSTGLRRITNTTEEAINLNPSISGDGRIVGFESTEDLAAAGGTDHFRAIRADAGADPPTFSQMGGTRAVSPAVSRTDRESLLLPGTIRWEPTRTATQKFFSTMVRG
jgi:hypothetical protein